MGEDEDRPEADAFGNKSVWARMAVIFAGPFFNFVFALILAFIMIGISGADLPISPEWRKSLLLRKQD